MDVRRDGLRLKSDSGPPSPHDESFTCCPEEDEAWWANKTSLSLFFTRISPDGPDGTVLLLIQDWKSLLSRIMNNLKLHNLLRHSHFLPELKLLLHIDYILTAHTIMTTITTIVGPGLIMEKRLWCNCFFFFFSCFACFLTNGLGNEMAQSPRNRAE